MLIWLPALFAAPYVELAEPDLTPDEIDERLEEAAGRAPVGTTHVALEGPEPLAIAPVPDKEPDLRSAPVDHPGRADGALSGKGIYLSQCHGFIWYDSLWSFSTQRGNLYDTVEDFHNPEGMNQYLARYLENAGAAVFTTKERGMNRRSAIADNDGDGYSEAGSGFADGAAGFADHGPWVYGENPFDAGTTRTFPASGGGVATWVPEVPVDGVYAVYASWDSDGAHAKDAHYRITHPGDTIDRTYDQTVHGSTWQYVETLWLPAGVGGLTVELIGDSAESGKKLSADAVRIGGGMGDVRRHDDLSGRPRWEEGAIQYTQYNGAPTSVYDPYADGNGSDPSSRSRWADWEHPSGEDAIYVSWHSNAGGGTGTSTYTYESGSTKGIAGSEDLSELLQEELVDAFRALWDPDWTSRGTKTAAFSEVNPSHNNEMPAALIELAFHDHSYDVELLKEPAFRRDASRAMYRAIVRYFADKDGTTPIYLPEAPIDVALVHDTSGQLALSWSPGPAAYPYGDDPTSYLVQTSIDGRSWDNGFTTSGTSVVLEASKGSTLFARVSGLNEGGLSFPSEVVGARRARDGSPIVLLVGGFDRLQGSLLPWEAVGGSVGDVRRMELWRVNPYDQLAAHGRALDAAGVPFDGIADERLGDVDLGSYDLVIWAAGEESTADETLSSAQQAALSAFIESGGGLWISGAEVFWDLDAQGSATDQAFCTDVLETRMGSDDAGTSTATGSGPLEGLDLSFGEDVGGAYPVEYPDALTSAHRAVVSYGSGAIAGVLGDRIFLLGYPFETIGSEADRTEMMERLLRELLTDWDDTGPGGDDTGPGPDDTGGAGDPEGPGWQRVPLGGGCGCGATSVPSALGWLVLLPLVVGRRRQGQVSGIRVNDFAPCHDPAASTAPAPAST